MKSVLPPFSIDATHPDGEARIVDSTGGAVAVVPHGVPGGFVIRLCAVMNMRADVLKGGAK